MTTDRRAVWTYYAYKATTSYGFYVPFSTLYLLHQGYGLDVVGFTQSAFLIAMVVAEIPAGYAADRLGRRSCLGLGNAIGAIVMGAYPFVGSIDGWIAVYALWGIGWACHSAIGEAWLYDLLSRDSRGSAFARVSGRGASVELVVSAGSALVASLLYAVDPGLPFLANACLAAVGLPLLLALPATRDGGEDPISVRETIAVLRLQISRPEVRWLVAYAALFNVLFSMTRWLEQPALEAVGFPVVGLGALYAGFKLLSAAAAATTGRVQETVGARSFFALMIPVCGAAYALIAIVPAFVLPVLVLRRLLDRVSGPIRNQYLNDRLDGASRATVLSGASLALNLASGVSNVALGRVAEATGPIAVLPLAGIAVSIAAGLLWVGTSPVRSIERGSPTTAPAAGD